MSLGEAWWFVDELIESAPRQVLEYLSERGITYRHPEDSRIWVFDGVGSRREASLEFVLREWAAGRQLTMQTWVDADTDVVVTIEPARSLLTFGLDGLLTSEAEDVVAALLLGAATRISTRMFVVDRMLPDRGAEWSRVASGSTATPYEPDFLLLRGSSGDYVLRMSSSSWLA